MTSEARELQENAVKKLINLAKSNQKEITFKAPTGSGKTVMMAKFMNEMLENESVIFIVSSLSKGDLARQNFMSFEWLSRGDLGRLKPFLINSEIGGEERLSIPLGHNVYVLPRDLYKEKSRLKSGAMAEFLLYQSNNQKKIILIKDECHIATSNLNDLVKRGYFAKVINFSATPKSDADAEISEIEAVNAKLIKDVTYMDDEYDNKVGLMNAFENFKDLKIKYKKIGINPAIIIQISNKDKAPNEIKLIKEILNQNAFKNLKWVLFVEKDSECDTNDFFKVKKLPVRKWKEYAKDNTSSLDVIIFKMVITEGWDIPRACMLYQMRDSKSKQLDEQVIGRVRRNPCLAFYEELDEAQKGLIDTAFVYGVKPKEDKSIGVTLKGQIHKNLFDNEIIREFSPFKRIELKLPNTKPDTKNNAAQIDIDSMPTSAVSHNIFEAWRAFKNSSDEVQKCGKDYVTSYEEWFKFVGNLGAIDKKIKEILEDYTNAQIAISEVPNMTSFYMKTDVADTEVVLKEWIWDNGEENIFYFDSVAERDWCKILRNLSEKCVKSIKIADKEIYLFGKNFPSGSNIKFEYFNGEIKTSYPDFILKDRFERIHIFEVKSVNISREMDIDKGEYEGKIEALRKGYKNASVKTPYIFYLPILKGSEWQIHKFENGDTQTLSKAQFEEMLKNG